MAETLDIVLIIYCLLLLMLLMGWLKVRRQSMPPRKPGNVGISLIVALRNEAENIEDLIGDLSVIAYPPDRFEIILINDHSTDSTATTLSKLTTGVSSIKVFDLPDGKTGKKQALLFGIQQSRFEVIVTTDADCRFSKHLLLCVASYYENPRNKMVVGAVKLVSNHSFFSRLQVMEFTSLMGTTAAAIGLEHPVMCNGANLSFRKETFLEVNGYDDNLNIASGDDEFLMRKIQARYPGSIRFLNYYEAVVSSKPQKTLADFFHQRLRWAGKWRNNSDVYTQLLAVLVLAAQVSFFSAVIRNCYHLDFSLSLVLIKIFLEAVFLLWVGRFLDRRFDVLAFMVLQIFYPWYVVSVGLLSFFIPYRWKNRNYKQ